MQALDALLRNVTAVQTEATITHPSLPKLHLKRCMVGRLTVRCQSLENLEIESSTITNLHIQCPQLRYKRARASCFLSLPLPRAPAIRPDDTKHVGWPCTDAKTYMQPCDGAEMFVLMPVACVISASALGRG